MPVLSDGKKQTEDHSVRSKPLFDYLLKQSRSFAHLRNSSMLILVYIFYRSVLLTNYDTLPYNKKVYLCQIRHGLNKSLLV